MNITDMVYIMTGFFEAIVSIMFINTYKREEDKNHVKYIVSAAVLAVMINISNNVLNYGYMNMIFVLVSICIISFVFNGNLKTALMSGIMLVAVLIQRKSQLCLLLHIYPILR